MVYNGYYKVMSNIPKMGHLPTPGKSRLQYRQRGQLTIFWRWHKIETDLPTTSNMHRIRETKTHPSIKYSFWANNNDSEQYVLPRQKLLIEDHSLHHPKSF